MFIHRVIKGGIALLASIGVYLAIIRPRQLRWGATDDEAAAPMLGDEVVANPHFLATRAVTIAATPAQIWPWVAQIGTGRAGWYSIDWIDNAGKPSAEHILPELQPIAEGDFIPFTPDGQQGMWVHNCEPPYRMLWSDRVGRSTWLWQLAPTDEGQTRLITRLRTRYTWSFPWALYYLLFDVGDIVMMRACLLGIKRRAEQRQPLTA